MNEAFRKFAARTADAIGSPWAFLAALLSVIAWLALAPLFGFTNTFYQLLINSGTTVITFLVVFLIQNTQNRDAKAIHLKLDELIRAVEGARTGLVDLEHLSDEQLARLQEQFQRLQQRQNVEVEELGELEVDVDQVEEKVQEIEGEVDEQREQIESATGARTGAGRP